jgi:taurine dioxygenase
MKIRKIAGALGAEISGVDLREPTAPEVEAIRQAYLDHGVIFFRGQELNSEQFLRFARLMGEPVPYPFLKGLPDYPEIIEVKKLEHETLNFGGVWHSDTTYLPEPPKGTMLLAREIPPYGGDTLFASQTRAYEALSETLRGVLAGLVGISSSAKADVSRTREDRLKEDNGSASRTEYRAEHPVVRTHPETGRKALYVNPAHTECIKQLAREESDAVLAFLYAHQVRPEFTCRFSWEVGSLAYWDNRCALHNPVNDYHGYRRLLHRITLRGDKTR